MERLKFSPFFGLASENEVGRREALEWARLARDAVQKIEGRLGRPAVRAVEIHPAPQQGKPGVRSSSKAFARSLEELRTWDWRGAQLWVEHCDRAIPNRISAKGFLALEEELAAIQESSQRAAPGSVGVGVMINWGRSAIEGRSAETPVRHLRQAREAGLLKGLFFSGCTAKDPLYGEWADSHAPFGGKETGCLSTSLLTADRVKESLQAADLTRLSVLGLKIQALPQELPVEGRIERIRQWVLFLSEQLEAETVAPTGTAVKFHT